MPKNLRNSINEKIKRSLDELLQLVNNKNDLYVDWKKNSKHSIFITKKKDILGRLIKVLIHK